MTNDQYAWRLWSSALMLAATAVPPHLCAQASLTLTVEDSRGSALDGAMVEDALGHLLGRTNADGQLTIHCAVPCSLLVATTGFADKKIQLVAATTIRLEPTPAKEEVTVTSYRAPLGALESQQLRVCFRKQRFMTLRRSLWMARCATWPVSSCSDVPVRW